MSRIISSLNDNRLSSSKLLVLPHEFFFRLSLFPFECDGFFFWNSCFEVIFCLDLSNRTAVSRGEAGEGWDRDNECDTNRDGCHGEDGCAWGRSFPCHCRRRVRDCGSCSLLDSIKPVYEVARDHRLGASEGALGYRHGGMLRDLSELP